MKKSQYIHFFDCCDQYVGYSWLANDYTSFPLAKKDSVKRILDNPNTVLTNKDSSIYKKLMKKQILIPEGVDEFHYIWDQHKKAIRNTNRLRLIILPTLACNLDCPYCYETHTNSKMEPNLVKNIKSYLKKKVGNLKHLSLSWFGGEPLLYPDIIQDIGNFASELATEARVIFDSSITTNATLLTDDNISVLDKTGVRQLQVTLDGSSSTHNRTRVPADGTDTYDQIVDNVKNYLDFNPDNRLTLRIHLHSTDEQEFEGIKRIFDEFETCKNQLDIYLRQLFSSCTEEWNHDLLEAEGVSPTDKRDDKKEKVMLKLYEEALKRGFEIARAEKTLSACYADYDSGWVVKPDGLLHKCTVALEEDRSLARLTENGIKYFWGKYSRWQKRTSQDSFSKEMKNCSVFPFSWGGCPYSNYQNPSKSASCKEIKESVRTKEKLMAIKSRYKSEECHEN